MDKKLYPDIFYQSDIFYKCQICFCFSFAKKWIMMLGLWEIIKGRMRPIARHEFSLFTTWAFLTIYAEPTYHNVIYYNRRTECICWQQKQVSIPQSLSNP